MSEQPKTYSKLCRTDLAHTAFETERTLSDTDAMLRTIVHRKRLQSGERYVACAAIVVQHASLLVCGVGMSGAITCGFKEMHAANGPPICVRLFSHPRNPSISVDGGIRKRAAVSCHRPHAPKVVKDNGAPRHGVAARSHRE